MKPSKFKYAKFIFFSIHFVVLHPIENGNLLYA